MPFKSKAQARWMFAKKPAMAKRWAKHTKSIKSLPEKKGEGDCLGTPFTDGFFQACLDLQLSGEQVADAIEKGAQAGVEDLKVVLERIKAAPAAPAPEPAEKVAAFKTGFFCKLAEMGLRPDVFLQRVKQADLSDILSSVIGAGTSAGKAVGGAGLSALSAGGNVLGQAALLGPLALGAGSGALEAFLDAPSVEDIEALRKSEMAATYERLAQQIRERVHKKRESLA
jgi:hypothetical protein